MGKSKKDGRKRGGHKNTQGKEYWKSRLHKGGEVLGKDTKKRTHRVERRRSKKLLVQEEP
jgi:hypothetical protein